MVAVQGVTEAKRIAQPGLDISVGIIFMRKVKGRYRDIQLGGEPLKRFTVFFPKAQAEASVRLATEAIA